MLLLLLSGEIAGFGGLGASSTVAWTADGLDFGDLLLILVGLQRAVDTRLVTNQLVSLIRCLITAIASENLVIHTIGR